MLHAFANKYPLFEKLKFKCKNDVNYSEKASAPSIHYVKVRDKTIESKHTKLR